MTLNKLSNLQQRLTISGLGISLLLISIALSFNPYFSPFFSLIAASIIGTAVWEFYDIGKAKGHQPLDALGIVGTIFFVVAVFLSTQSTYAKYFPEIVLAGIIATAFLYFFIKGVEPYVNLAITFFAFLYLTIPLSTLIVINYNFQANSPQDGRAWLLYLLTVVKMTDTGAYFIGKALGKHKFSPYISPKKTWEGAIGGLIVGVAFGFILRAIIHFWNPMALQLSIEQCLGLGIVISVIGQFGDLAESLLKRDGKIKDSSHLPGLGGMLDILDSLIFTAPLMYLYLKLAF